MKRIPKFILKENNYLFIFYLFISILLFLNLKNFPVFIDEITYVNIAEKIYIPGNLIQTTNNGILPGLPMLLFFVQKLFNNSLNLLIASRALLALCSLISSILIYKITATLLNKKTAILAGIIYLSIPYNFLHSRLILMEPLFTLYFLFALFFYIQFLKTYFSPTNSRYKIKYVIVSTIFLFLSFITKPLAIVLFPTFFTAPLLFISSQKNIQFKFKKILMINILGFIILVLITAPLLIGSIDHYYQHYGLNNIKSLSSNLKVNLQRSDIWIRFYLTPALTLSLLFGGILAFLKKNKTVAWLLCSLVFVIIAESLFGGKLFFPRHLYPISIFVSIIVAWFIDKVSAGRGYLTILILLVILFSAWSFDIKLIKDPTKVNFAPEDKQQFFEDWSSGVGISEISNDLKSLSAEKRINLLIGDEPLLYWALPKIYGIGNSNLIILKNYIGGEADFDIKLPNDDRDSFLLLNIKPYVPSKWLLELVSSYPKGPNRTINLYRIKKDKI